MVLYTLDAIVRNCLFKKRYPMHMYIEYLVYGASGLRELTIDDLKIVNTKLISVDPNTSEAYLPNDFVSCIECGVESGQKIRPLVSDSGINPLPAYTSSFEQTTYLQNARNASGDTILLYNYLLPLFWNTVTWNEYGENIGRLFGWGNRGTSDTFTIDKARGVIIVNNSACVGNIVLKYISDGQSLDAISQIPAEAYDTIQNYIWWQHKEHNRSYSDTEKARGKDEYLTARDVLRGRLNDLTVDKIRRIFQKNYMAAARS